MKTSKSLLLTACILFCSIMLNAQSNEYKNSLRISPIQFGKSYFEVSYEIGMNNGKSSIQISPMILLKKNGFEEFKGFQTELQYRSYLKRFNKEETNIWAFSNIDFFAGGYTLGLTYESDHNFSRWDPETNTETFEMITRNIFAAEAGIFVGVKFTFGKRVCLDLLAGGGVRYTDISTTPEDIVDPPYYYFNDNEVFEIGYYGVKPKLNLQLGITL